jgi:hypothetical protein
MCACIYIYTHTERGCCHYHCILISEYVSCSSISVFIRNYSSDTRQINSFYNLFLFKEALHVFHGISLNAKKLCISNEGIL